MSGNHPASLRYSASHEYVHLEGDLATIGITQHATEELGDVVFVELPKVGTHLAAGSAFGVVESVKAVSDLYMPVAGTIEAVNLALESEPARVNEDPYEKGWMIKVKVDDAGDVAKLLTQEQYLAQI